MMDLAIKFAESLDKCDYRKAASFLSNDCVYQFRQQELMGVDQIIGSYQGNFNSVSGQLDKIEFKSQVTQNDEQEFTLHYLDIIYKDGKCHEHRCQQKIWIQGQRITRIKHIDLPGEVDSLEKFFADNNIRPI